MTRPASYDDPGFRTAERRVARRRLVAAIVTVVAFGAVAGGAALGAAASAHEDRATELSSQVVLAPTR